MPQEDTRAAEEYTSTRVAHWDAVARRMALGTWAGRYYRRRLTEVYHFLVPPGLRVLELGCGSGDLLAAVRPSCGVGVDFSAEMVKLGSRRHPSLRFVHADAQAPALAGQFDVIILSDLINDLWDVQACFEQVTRLSTARTRVILNFYSRVWETPLWLARRLGLARPILYQNWLTGPDTANLLNLAGLETIRRWTEILWPIPTPVLAHLANRYLVRVWPLTELALTNFMVARPKPASRLPPLPSVSVIVPARNEAQNIPDVLARTPEMGSGTELIFVEGHSRDDTYAVIEQAIAACPERLVRLLRQAGVGKGDAVRLGFAEARGEILMILDADLTVPPEDLPRFYSALVSGVGDFVNGVRLVYPMERRAMRFLNLLANRLFGAVFSWLLGQTVKDTLCGTKVLWRGDYDIIAANRARFGAFDPFGDFDLIFGAAALNLKIVDLPIRYRERVYGQTNIRRWRHGWLLVRMVGLAARRFKFR